jgi:hypothetical protein
VPVQRQRQCSCCQPVPVLVLLLMGRSDAARPAARVGRRGA